jgi:hypothetical protein
MLIVYAPLVSDLTKRTATSSHKKCKCVVINARMLTKFSLLCERVKIYCNSCATVNYIRPVRVMKDAETLSKT